MSNAPQIARSLSLDLFASCTIICGELHHSRLQIQIGQSVKGFIVVSHGLVGLVTRQKRILQPSSLAGTGLPCQFDTHHFLLPHKNFVLFLILSLNCLLLQLILDIFFSKKKKKKKKLLFFFPAFLTSFFRLSFSSRSFLFWFFIFSFFLFLLFLPFVCCCFFLPHSFLSLFSFSVALMRIHINRAEIVLWTFLARKQTNVNCNLFKDKILPKIAF